MKQKLSIQPQSTIETCLSMCLIALLEQKNITVEKTAEMDILIEGLKFTKFDYSTGHVASICQKYPIQAMQYVENPYFFNFLSKYKYPENMQLINQKINKKFIDKNKNNLPFIIYIDHFYFSGIHTSHFVILEKIGKTNATILDPWDGKRKIVKTKILFSAITSLRNRLKISPKIIQII